MDLSTIILRIRGGDTIDVSTNQFDIGEILALIFITNTSSGYLHIRDCRRLTNSEFARLANARGKYRRVALHD